MLGLYVTFLLITVILANRFFLVGNFLEPGGIYFFPLAFPILDIVGEVYGYAYPRLFIWIGAICELLFACATTAVAHLPYPSYFHHADAYQAVLDPTVRFVFSSLIGTITGEFLNIYFLARWKIKLRGKSFITRCILSTAIGQAALTIIVDIFAFSGELNMQNLTWMMFCGYAYKMAYAVILAFPAWIIIRKLKKIENLDYFDIDTNFNPFKLEIKSV